MTKLRSHRAAPMIRISIVQNIIKIGACPCLPKCFGTQAGKCDPFYEEFHHAFISVDFDTLFLVFFIIKNFYPEQQLCLTENTVLQTINTKFSLVADSPLCAVVQTLCAP